MSIELERQLAESRRAIELLEKRVARLERLESVLRSIEVDVAAMIAEIRASLLPRFLQGKRASLAHVGHGPNLEPETLREIRRNSIARARAAKPIGTGKGSVRDPSVKRRLQAGTRG